MKKILKGLIISGGVIFVLFIATIIIFVQLSASSEEKFENLVINEVDLATVEDGVYFGRYNIFPITVEVEVTIQNHHIIEIIILKHFNGQGGAAEEITQKVIEKQSVDVEYISGATGSSKVILKAIEHALTK